MNVRALSELPPWEWPDEAADILSETLRDRAVAPDERELAAHLVAEIDVMDDRFAQILLDILTDASEPADLRAQSAIALGPGLEYADMLDPEDLEDEAISAPMIRQVEQALKALYEREGEPDSVRRAALEAAVRAPRPWHDDAIRMAHASSDPDWKLTAIFCLRFVEGFDEWILAALADADPRIRYQAMCAAGDNELPEAWPQVAAVLQAPTNDREFLLAAIDAAARINPEESLELLESFTESDDEEVAEVARDAIAMAQGLLGEFDEDEE